MSWLEDLLSNLQSGGVPPGFGAAPSASPFPNPPPPVDEAAAAQAAREAAGARMMRANQRRVDPFGMPDVNSAGIQLALDQAPAGTGVPVAPGASFAPMSIGLPPSVTAAKSLAAPPAPAPQAALPGMMPPGAVPGMPAGPGQAAPEDGPTDVSSRNRAPPAAMPPAAPAGAPMGLAPPPAEPSFLSRLNEGAKSIAPALLAAGSALQGDNSVAANMMKQREAQALQAQQGNATARLLQSKGASVPEIQAAIAGGPETLKALLGQYMGKDKFSVVQTKEVEDQYGGKRKVFQIFNATDGTFKDVPGNTAAEAKMAAGEGGGIDLTPDQKNRVQAIIEGREPYPAMSRATDAAKIRAAVHEADPAFDAVNYKARQETRTKFTKGKGADNLTAFNTAIGHLGSLDKSIDNLNNSGFPAWNKYIANPIAEQFDPKYQKGLKEFQTARTAVADELTRAFRGSGGNVHDIIQWENAINAADSPVALKAAVRAAAELLNSRISSIGDEYNRGMGTTKDPLELLNPKAAAAFQRMLEGSKPGAAPEGSKAAAPVKPGNYVWKNGALVPE